MHGTCVRCGDNLGYTPAEGVTIQCARCTMARCLRYECEDVARLQAVDMEAVAALRKQRGWSQGDLALHLRISKSAVGKAERGLILCPREVADWLDSQ